MGPPIPATKTGERENAKQTANLNNVIKIMRELKPTIETDQFPTKDEFVKLYSIICTVPVYLCL